MRDPEPGRLRPEIARAWHRARVAGLDPGMPVRDGRIQENLDRRSSLLIAAGPVLDRLVDDLAGTRFSVLLGDKESRIVERRTAASGLDRALDRVCAVPGMRYLEETAGTNALATAFELRRPIAVTGGEHFLEALHVFCCYGAPIRHPVTRRLEGVLDVSGPAADATPLLGVVVLRAVREIEQRLLSGSRIGDQRLLTEFQQHARGRGHAVLALGEGIVLGNPAAVDLVAAGDHALLRALAAESVERGARQREVVLGTGVPVRVRVHPIPGCPRGAVFDIIETGTRAPIPAVHTRIALITGEPGSGRTTAGRARAGPAAAYVAGADADDGDLAALRTALLRGTPVLVDDIHLLPVRFAARLAALLHGCAGPVTLTGSPIPSGDTERAALAACAMDRLELPPLRTRATEFAACAATLLRELCPGDGLRLAESALTPLASHTWPGNFRELEAVLRYAIRDRTRGVIIDRDLPPAYRTLASQRLSRMEIAERDAILAALRDTGGNRLAAAANLGISRTTLYKRLRRYRIR